MLTAFVALLVTCSSGDHTENALTYPYAMRSDTVDDYFGVLVADPYRWIEDMESEPVRKWIEAENDVSIPYLAAIPAREALIRRFRELWNYEKFSLPRNKAGRYLYWHNDGLQDQSILYVSDSLEGEARVLIDPNEFREDATNSIGSYEVCHDGSEIAYSVSEGGSDWKDWRVRNPSSRRRVR